MCGCSGVLTSGVSQSKRIGVSGVVLSSLREHCASVLSLSRLSSAPISTRDHVDVMSMCYSAGGRVGPVLSRLAFGGVKSFVGVVGRRNSLCGGKMRFHGALVLCNIPKYKGDAITGCVTRRANLPLIVTELSTLMSSLLNDASGGVQGIFSFTSSQPYVLFLSRFSTVTGTESSRRRLNRLGEIVGDLLRGVSSLSDGDVFVTTAGRTSLLSGTV